MTPMGKDELRKSSAPSAVKATSGQHLKGGSTPCVANKNFETTTISSQLVDEQNKQNYFEYQKKGKGRHSKHAASLATLPSAGSSRRS